MGARWALPYRKPGLELSQGPSIAPLSALKPHREESQINSLRIPDEAEEKPLHLYLRPNISDMGYAGIKLRQPLLL